MRIHVGSLNPVKINAVKRMFAYVFPYRDLDVVGVDVHSGISEQPFDEETLSGALNRARQALDDAELAVGIEGGLIQYDKLGLTLGVEYCVILDQNGRSTWGHSPGFMHPGSILDEIDRGKSLGQAIGELSGNLDIGSEEGAIGYLSRGIMNRTELTEQAVLMALIPRIRSDLYLND